MRYTNRRILYYFTLIPFQRVFPIASFLRPPLRLIQQYNRFSSTSTAYTKISIIRDTIRSVLLVEMMALRLRVLPVRLNLLPLAPSDGAELWSDDVLRDRSMAMSRMLRDAE